MSGGWNNSMYGWDRGPTMADGYAAGQEMKQKNMNMAQAMEDNKYKNAAAERAQVQGVQDDQLKAAQRGAYAADENGNFAPTKEGLAKVGSVDGGAAYAMQQQQVAQQRAQEQAKLEDMGKKLDTSHKILGTVYDDASLKLAKANAQKLGLSTDGIPDVYDKKFFDDLKVNLMDKKDSWKLQNEQMEAQNKHLDARARMMEQRNRTNEMSEARSDRLAAADERQANQIHARVVTNLQRDPAMKAKLGQYQNLQAAMSNFENAEHPTAQSFDELQQAVRANLGIKGASAVGEREHTTMNSLGLNASRMTQFLTGNPQDIDKDKGFAKHMKDLVALERKNIEGQVGKHLNTLSAGHGSMYKKYPQLQQDLIDAGNAYSSEFTPQAGQAPQPPAAPGAVRMQAPDGSIRMVAPGSVDAAIQAGGKRL